MEKDAMLIDDSGPASYYPDALPGETMYQYQQRKGLQPPQTLCGGIRPAYGPDVLPGETEKQYQERKEREPSKQPEPPSQPSYPRLTPERQLHVAEQVKKALDADNRVRGTASNEPAIRYPST
jgi:hypothetical protein